MRAACLVVAKAPLAGRAKTRLGRRIGMAVAADLAAAALLDTLDACARRSAPSRCSIALDGDLADAVRGDEIAERLRGWHVFAAARVADLGERLALAHADAPAGRGCRSAWTPRRSPRRSCTACWMASTTHDAALAPAADGGWWALALAHGDDAGALAGVPMSTPATGDDTAAALRARGLTVADGPMLRDVDTVEDAALVAAQAPWTRFAATWRAVTERSA